MDAVASHVSLATTRALPGWLLLPRAAGWVFGMALLLAMPSLWVGWVADDYYHAARFLAPDLLPGGEGYSPFDLFTVSDGSAVANRHLVDQGLLPWWTDSQFRFQLWRPLAELSHWIDYTLWPATPWLMHLHHLLWFGALLGVVLQLYRRLFPDQPLAVMAFALFALSANLSQTVTWLAARNTLMGATLGIAALLLHIRSTQEGRPHLRWLACGLFALALLASEFGLGASTWLFAWVMVIESGNLWQKALRLLPYGLLMGLWALVYFGGNYGVAESSFYLDPLAHPAEYIKGLVERTPDLLFSALFGFSTAMLGMPTREIGGWLVSLIGIVLVMLPVWRYQRQPVFRFLMLGSLLSLLPIAAGPGGPRALAFVSLGAAPWVAVLLLNWLGGASNRRLTAFVAWPLLVFVCLGLVGRPAAAYLMPDYNGTYIEAPARQLPAANREDERLILLNPSSVLHSVLYPLARVPMGISHIPPLTALASGTVPIHVTRDSANSLILAPEQGFLAEPAAFFVRQKNQRPQVGERFELDGLNIEILSLNGEGLPAQVRFQFALPLESAPLRFLQCRQMQFKPFVLPAVGESVTLPACRS